MMSAASEPCFLAVDFGTSGLRAALITESGAIRRLKSASALPVSREDGRATIDCDVLWRTTCSLLRQVVSDVKVAGIGVAAQQGWVFLDAMNQPIQAAILWPDIRAAAEAQRLRNTLGTAGEALAGRRFVRELASSRLLWLAGNRPQAFSQLRSVLSIKDFLVFKLTNQLVTDPTHASYSGLLDVRRRQWAPQLATASGITLAHLPPIRDAIELAGVVTPSAASESALPVGVPVAVGAPDGTTGAVGAGAVTAGLTIDVAGTTDVVFQTAATLPAKPSEAVVVNAYCLGALWTLGGPTGMTGGTVRWLAGLLGWSDLGHLYSELGSQLARAEIGASGVTVIPSITGSRFPDWNDAATGSIAGLRFDHTAVEILRAAEEAGAFVVLETLSELERNEIYARDVRLVGGASRQPWAMQLRADAWARPVVITEEADATLLGAAVFSGVAAGVFEDADEATRRCVRIRDVFQPQASQTPAYERSYERWRKLKELNATLASPSSPAVGAAR
jgi:xylulokinase